MATLPPPGERWRAEAPVGPPPLGWHRDGEAPGAEQCERFRPPSQTRPRRATARDKPWLAHPERMSRNGNRPEAPKPLEAAPEAIRREVQKTAAAPGQRWALERGRPDPRLATGQSQMRCNPWRTRP